MENQSWGVKAWPESNQVVHVPQADEARRGLNSQGHKGSLRLSRALVPCSLVPCSVLFPLPTSHVNCRLGQVHDRQRLGSGSTSGRFTALGWGARL